MVGFLWDEFDILVTISSIGRALASAGWSKKVARRVAQERNADLRDFYLYSLPAFRSYHLVYIDESGCNKRIGFRRTGWSPLGVTLVQIARFHRDQRQQILPAYTQDGILLVRMFQGSTNTQVGRDRQDAVHLRRRHRHHRGGERSASSADGFLGERFPGPRRRHRRHPVLPHRRAARDRDTCYSSAGAMTASLSPLSPSTNAAGRCRSDFCPLELSSSVRARRGGICPELRTRTASDDSRHNDLNDGGRRHVPYSSKRKTEGLQLDIIRVAKTTIDYYGCPRASCFGDCANAMKHWEEICTTFTERTLTLPADHGRGHGGAGADICGFLGRPLRHQAVEVVLALRLAVEHLSQSSPLASDVVPGPVLIMARGEWPRALRVRGAPRQVCRRGAKRRDRARRFPSLRPRSGRLTLCACTQPGF